MIMVFECAEYEFLLGFEKNLYFSVLRKKSIKSIFDFFSVGLGHDQPLLVKNFNRGKSGQIADHGSILI